METPLTLTFEPLTQHHVSVGLQSNIEAHHRTAESTEPHDSMVESAPIVRGPIVTEDLPLAQVLFELGIALGAISILP